jgi:eukaryotic-like serine/threonine-protein kinase
VKHPDPIKVGSKVAGYSVLAELGHGAASAIYLVQDPKKKQIWALKHVQKREPKDQRFLDQTLVEYEIGSKLNHPSVRRSVKLVKARSFLSVKELYLLMEYVDGISLEMQRPESIEEAVLIFRKVAEGLAHMHASGYVHADMKPNNIVITESDDVKVIDLGQSCKSGTIKERIQGTPDYIAPEQVHRRAITPKTDIYNLGATMYWTLTGKHIPTAMPKGDSLVSSLDDEMIEKPTPVRELNPKIPERLGELIMQCVEVDPINRPESMQKVADALDLVRAKMLAEARREAGETLGDDDETSDGQTAQAG